MEKVMSIEEINGIEISIKNDVEAKEQNTDWYTKEIDKNRLLSKHYNKVLTIQVICTLIISFCFKFGINMLETSILLITYFTVASTIYKPYKLRKEYKDLRDSFLDSTDSIDKDLISNINFINGVISSNPNYYFKELKKLKNSGKLDTIEETLDLRITSIYEGKI